ncbi:MAG: ABC transporter ATP-binding protein [Chloroflexota bacterium]
MNNAVLVEGLTKTYPLGKGQPPLTTVDGIDFGVQEGEVFGFLGPNGAGKTTTMRMLTGLSRPTSGRATLLGLELARDLPGIKKRIGVVPESSNLYDELTAFDNLVSAALRQTADGAVIGCTYHRQALHQLRAGPFRLLWGWC